MPDLPRDTRTQRLSQHIFRLPCHDVSVQDENVITNFSLRLASRSVFLFLVKEQSVSWCIHPLPLSWDVKVESEVV